MKLPKLSIIMPAHNEEGSIEKTLTAFQEVLWSQKIPYEIVVIDDHCTDSTATIVKSLTKHHPHLKLLPNRQEPGFGMAVRTGLQAATGEYVAIVMADLSDDPQDLVKMYRKMNEGYDCVFGDRFARGAKVTGYPLHKLILNRIVNHGIRYYLLSAIKILLMLSKCILGKR